MNTAPPHSRPRPSTTGAPRAITLVAALALLAVGGILLWRAPWLREGDRRDGATIQVNERGFRGPVLSVEKPAGTRRVVYLGDSVTFGEGIARWQDTFPFLVDSLLAARDSLAVETLNLAVEGHAPWQEYDVLAREGLRHAPDLVVVGFSLDDVPESMRRDDLADGQTPGVETLMREPGRADVRTAWDLALADLQRIVDLCAARAVPVLVVVFPRAGQLADPLSLAAPQRVIMSYADARRFGAVDLLLPIANHLRDHGSAAPDLFLDDAHLTTRGHRVVAEMLAGHVGPRLSIRP